MKDLIYDREEGKWRYLDCSMMGSYYIPCKIIEEHNDGSMTIEIFDDFSQETEIKIIPPEEVEWPEITKDDEALHSARFILEDLNHEQGMYAMAQISGLPMGVIVSAFENIFNKEYMDDLENLMKKAKENRKKKLENDKRN